jgi:hypothetical protein
LRALLSLEPADAELDYRRLVIEYPGGTFSDRALIRLAQASQARGNVADARQYMADFLRDYPQSPLRVEARSLIAKLGEGEPEVPEPIPGPAGDVAVGDRGTQEAGSSSGSFTLQLGAYSTERRALSLLLEARAAELEPRLVRVAGSALLRVRLGEFATREEAEAGAAALSERGFQAVVSSDRGLEEPVR